MLTDHLYFFQAYINCAVNIRWVAYVLTLRGMTYMITCFLSGKMNQYFPRWVIMAISYLIELAVLITWLILQPSADQAWVFFVIQGFEGIGSASLRVQVTGEDNTLKFENLKVNIVKNSYEKGNIIL